MQFARYHGIGVLDECILVDHIVSSSAFQQVLQKVLQKVVHHVAET